MLTVVAFVFALAILIGIHEYGHYRMALACGVRVLRFSIGFGKPLIRWVSRAGHTEYVISAIPLGGYVKMLDEREAVVPAAERHFAFNTQSLGRRSLIVGAGPIANLVLAVILYTSVSWLGVQEPRAILASPVHGSLAHAAGLRGGELVLSVTRSDRVVTDVESFDQLRWILAQAALNGQDVTLTVSPPEGELVKTEFHLALSQLNVNESDALWMREIGLLAPWTSPTVGDLLPESPAEMAGLQSGDTVLQVNEQPITDGQALRQLIRQSVNASGDGVPLNWVVLRQSQTLRLTVTPRSEMLNGERIGRIGAFIGQPPETVLIRKGPIDGIIAALDRTWDVSILSLKMMGRMLVGQASLKNLTGPLTIADYAGRSANIGLTSYLAFLALISVSLGVLNLLPLPVLDGGHLMYYLWEGVTGRPVSEHWQDRFQRGGVVILVGMMSIALFNDVTRLMG